MLNEHQIQKETIIFRNHSMPYDSIDLIYPYEEEVKQLFQCFSLDTRYTSYSDRRSCSLSAQKKTTKPFLKPKKPRKEFQILMKQYDNSGDSGYIIKSVILKKWAQILKQILKEAVLQWSKDEISILNQFFFNLHNSEQSIRKLLGFEMELEQVADCRRIRHYLLQVIDSTRIIHFIQKGKVANEKRKQIIESLQTIKLLILDPTIPLTIV